VWVPGCSTGEEAYSLAMAFSEYCREKGVNFPIQIFATDVNERALARARAGIYPLSIASSVSEERLQRFFVKADPGYQISQQIRGMCIFARQNLVRDPPFSKLDLLCCRNVLIYMGPLLQQR